MSDNSADDDAKKCGYKELSVSGNTINKDRNINSSIAQVRKVFKHKIHRLIVKSIDKDKRMCFAIDKKKQAGNKSKEQAKKCSGTEMVRLLTLQQVLSILKSQI